MNNPDILHPGFAKGYAEASSWTTDVICLFDRHQASQTRLRRPSSRRSGALPCREEGYAQASRRVSLRLIALTCLLWSAAAIVGQAGPRYVVEPGTPGGTNAGNYDAWASAATQIQWAVDAAQIDETVWVSNGTYNLTSQINILTNIIVRSLNGTNFTFINGNYPAYTNRCVYMTNGTLDGFTISNGFLTNYTVSAGEYLGGAGIGVRVRATVKNCYIYKNYITNFNGGGIHSVYATGLIISNCTIVSNTCDTRKSGGGICLSYVLAPGLLIDSYISGNIGGGGGGVFHANGALLITNCTIAGNTAIADYGGGLRLQTVTAVAGNLVISNNTAPGAGGVMLDSGKLINSIIINNKSLARYNHGGGISIFGGVSGSYMSNCQVIGNSADYSGGVRFSGITGFASVVANCIIANNVASNSCGGISVANGGLVKNCLIYCNTNNYSSGGGVYLTQNALYAIQPYGLVNCTIVDNRANGSGAGINAAGITNYIENCIVVSNVTLAGAQANIYNDTAANTNNYWHTCAPDVLAPNQGNITGNPLFIEQTNYNYRLSANSPCINAGTNQSWMTGAVDLDGHRRIDKFSGQVDIGCYEYLPSGVMFGFH